MLSDVLVEKTRIFTMIVIITMIIILIVTIIMIINMTITRIPMLKFEAMLPLELQGAGRLLQFADE